MESKHNLSMKLGQFVSYYKRKFYQKILQKLWSWKFQFLLCLQKI